MALTEMAPGGVWIALDGKKPVYVTHEAHIKRLLSEEGGRIIADPRSPTKDDPGKAATSTEETLRAQLAEMQAQMAILLAERNAKQESEEPDASTLNHGTTDSPRPAHDKRPIRR